MANSQSNAVSILLGRGDGTFQDATSYTVGSDPTSLAVGDFNGDGAADLAVSNKASDTVSILLGQGDGTFLAAQNYAAGPNPQFVAVSDVNGDGHADLTVANDVFSAGTVTILLGQNDGSFQTAQSYAAGFRPWSVAVGDFNGDNFPDLAVASNTIPGTVAILLVQGDGTFRAGPSYTTGSLAQSVVAGDFNSDGHLDLAVANTFSATVSILLGQGDGTFQTAPSYAAGAGTSLAAGDLNGDGHLDLAVTGGSAVSILLGNGDGTFQAAVDYAAGSNPQSVTVGDLNHDGHLDLAVANGGVFTSPGNTVSVLMGRGDGSLQAAQSYLVGTYPFSVAVADVNDDSIADLVVTNQGSAPNTGTVSVLLGNGDGTFRAGGSFAAGSGPNAIAVGDFNGDGKVDIVTSNSYEIVVRGVSRVIESNVRVFFGNGDGTFQAGSAYDVPLGPDSVAVGDFNRDGILDLAVVSGGGYLQPGNTVSILLGNGDGSFQAAQNYTVGVNPQFVAVGDFNGDGNPDLAVVNLLSGTVSIVLGNGDGTFQAAQDYAVGSNPNFIAVGDFNGDNHLDLAVADGGSATVSVLLGNGDGTFQTAQGYAVDSGPQSVAVRDFNGDGTLDLAVANLDAGTVSILLGVGDGTFRFYQSYAVGSNPISVAAGNFNSDNFADLALANNASPGTITILINAADWGGGQAAPAHQVSPNGERTAQSAERGMLAGSALSHSPSNLLSVLPLTPSDLSLKLVQHELMETQPSQPTCREEMIRLRSLLLSRQARGAVFAAWNVVLEPDAKVVGW